MIKNCVTFPEILMPKSDVDLYKWSIVACDQYTSQPDYWNKVEEIVGDDTSTLHLILPEIYLEDENVEDRIQKVYKTMTEYKTSGKLQKLPKGAILTERYSGNELPRVGLVLSVDLEAYEYTLGSSSQIRPTEKTVVERIPPRLRVRKGANVELPHIMLLIDDENKTVIEPLFAKRNELKKVYDTELMMDSGSIKGYFIEEEKMLEDLHNALGAFCDVNKFNAKYNVTDKAPLQFAVGDGNHSMATAKAHWENIKKDLSDAEKETHPARYALVEVVNIHDDSLIIEPIHRVIFDANIAEALELAKEFYTSNGCTFYTSETAVDKADTHCFKLMNEGKSCYFVVENPKWALPIATVQSYIDFYESKQSAITVDYIHGEDIVEELTETSKNIGIILPDFAKNDIFKGVIMDGVLPKKTFSMGHAHEKRFYIECKDI